MILKTLLIFLLIITKSAFAAKGIPPSSPADLELKSLEVVIQIKQFYLAISSACIAFYLTKGKEIQKILLTKGGCISKAILIFTIISLFSLAAFFLWDMQTIHNQLLNKILNFNDLITEVAYQLTLLLTIIAFPITVWVIWKNE